MKFQTVYEAYLNDTTYQKLSSLIVHRNKIRNYCDRLGDVDIEVAFQESNLRDFIYNNDASSRNVYSALVNFHQFYHRVILNREIVPPFPIQDPKLKPKRKELDHVLFNKEQIKLLFHDDFYTHLNDENAALTLKASIALCLSAGYDSGDLSPSNHTDAMTMDDIEIQNGFVKVTNFTSQSNVRRITIRGECADHIKKYYAVRVNSGADSQNFICKLWDVKKLQHARNIQQEKPYEPHNLLNYMLKYISVKLNLGETLYATHLRTNMVYHSLLDSSGSSLHQIIEVFGFPPYVKYAFEKYCMGTNSTVYFGFNDFFDKSSSDEIGRDDSSTDEENNQQDIETRLNAYLQQKRPRDTKKVKEIKDLYDNTCQICGSSLTLLHNFTYSEVHHIQPHGKQHNGIDDLPNMLVLCPNHHTLFDLGVIGLDPMDPRRLIHIDKNNVLHNTDLKIWKHELSNVCVRYHFENIFTPLRDRLSCD